MIHENAHCVFFCFSPLNAMATTGGDAALALASSPKSSNQQVMVYINLFLESASRVSVFSPWRASVLATGNQAFFPVNNFYFQSSRNVEFPACAFGVGYAEAVCALFDLTHFNFC